MKKETQIKIKKGSQSATANAARKLNGVEI